MRGIISVLLIFALLFGCIQPSSGPVETPAEEVTEEPPSVVEAPEPEPVETEEPISNASIMVIDQQPDGCTRDYDESDTYFEHVTYSGSDYSIEFNSSSEDFGLPICSTPINDSDYQYCLSLFNYDEGYQVLSTSHRLVVEYLGDDWTILEMHPPESPQTTEGVLKGGFVLLAREKAHSNLHQGESIEYGGIKFQLDDLEYHNGTISAIVSAMDANGNVLKKQKIESGATVPFTINDMVYPVHVYRLTCGATFGGESKFAEMALLSEVFVLEDAGTIELDGNTCEVSVFWTNKGASEEDPSPDHLKEIVIDCP